MALLHWLQRNRLRAVSFLAACVALLLFDHAKAVVQSALDAGTIYQRVLTSGFKAAVPIHTAIVKISSATEPNEVTAVNVCPQRLFLSRLLPEIEKASPAVIVVDKFFRPDACPQQPEGTAALQTAVAKVLDRTPVVVAVRDNGQTPLPMLPFPDGASGRRVSSGSDLFDEDTRRVPFSWNHLTDSTGGPLTIKTLALTAAEARTPTLLQENARMRQFAEGSADGFVAFLPSRAYDQYTVSAVALLCGPQAGLGADWRNCTTPDDKARERLRGRVVLVGEFDFDRHDTVIGTVPGVELHANYVEAILSGDLFKAVPVWLTYVYGLVVFIGVELILVTGYRYRALAAVGIILAAYGICFLLVKVTGFYLNPGLGLIAWVFGRLSGLVRDRYLKEGARTAANPVVT